MQREPSHIILPFDFPGLEVGVPVGKRMPELIQRRGLQAMGSHQGDEQSYEIHGRCAAVSPRSGAYSVVHQDDGTERDPTTHAGEHLLRRPSSPVLRVSGPADELEPVFVCRLFGRRCDEAPGGFSSTARMARAP